MNWRLTVILLLIPLLILGSEVEWSALRSDYDRLFPIPTEAPTFEAFAFALQGFTTLKDRGEVKKDVLAIIDFSKASTEKRLWVVDLSSNKVLFHSLVAHGKNSGENYAHDFSNKPQSYKSSIGFYVTGNTYQGKHGLSLRLEGMEQGINNKAWERAIVMHGADYVSQSFINRVGRLGRSHGCPAVPVALHKDIIETLKNNACLFIWYPDPQYLERSKILPESRNALSRS